MTARVLHFPVNRVIRWPETVEPACALCGSLDALVGVEIETLSGKTTRCRWCAECVERNDEVAFGQVFGKRDRDR